MVESAPNFKTPGAADYGKFKQAFRQQAAAAVHTPEMKGRYAELVAYYGEAEVLAAIPAGVEMQRSRGFNEKWAARKFLIDDAEDLLDGRREEIAEQARDKLERDLYAASRTALDRRDKAEYERIRREYRDKVGGCILFGEYEQMVA